MIWHVVRFDMGALEEDARAQLESMLQALVEIDDVVWLRVARDIEEPAVTGLLTGFRDHAALERYRVHPKHLPVVERVRDLGIPVVRLDVDVDLPTSA